MLLVCKTETIRHAGPLKMTTAAVYPVIHILGYGRYDIIMLAVCALSFGRMLLLLPLAGDQKPLRTWGKNSMPYAESPLGPYVYRSFTY